MSTLAAWSHMVGLIDKRSNDNSVSRHANGAVHELPGIIPLVSLLKSNVEDKRKVRRPISHFAVGR